MTKDKDEGVKKAQDEGQKSIGDICRTVEGKLILFDNSYLFLNKVVQEPTNIV